MTDGETQTRPLSTDEKRDWLRLIRSENVGPLTFFRLLDRFGSVATALDALPSLARRGGGRNIRIADRAAADRELAAAERVGARIVAWGEPDYPPLLHHVDDAPPLLFVRGQAALLAKRAVGVVGARNASVNGRRFAEGLARDLGAGGLLVVSGLARGIDAAAHQGALASGTVGVLGGGVDVVYPAENRDLYDAMAEQGVLISEVAPGTQPQARHFPRRNRIISGMSRGVVVVEASPRSGSLITARLALEQGREVFAVPGSAMDPRARGTNDLIRQGATLTESADDVLPAINAESPRPSTQKILEFSDVTTDPPSDGELDDARRSVLESIGGSPTTVDELHRLCQFSQAVVSTVLLELELAGRLERHPGGKVSLILGP